MFTSSVSGQFIRKRLEDSIGQTLHVCGFPGRPGPISHAVVYAPVTHPQILVKAKFTMLIKIEWDVSVRDGLMETSIINHRVGKTVLCRCRINFGR